MKYRQDTGKRTEEIGILWKTGVRFIEKVNICDYTECKHVYKYSSCNDKILIL